MKELLEREAKLSVKDRKLFRKVQLCPFDA